MKLRGIDFGNVFSASGTLNFFGEGWPYHLYYKNLFPKNFDFRGSTLITKTTTLNERRGNMPLNRKLQPLSFAPDCIRVKFYKGIVLNAVGLSGPGAKSLFERGIWQNFDKPFQISFMSLGNTREEKISESERFIELFLQYLKSFRSDVGLQVNISCPNTKHSTKDMTKDALSVLEVMSDLEIPVDLKIGVADADINFIKEVEKSRLCDCLTCSNTIPWGKMSNRVNWKKLFGSNKSPLKKYGGGGLSGTPLFPIVCDWLDSVRQAGVSIPIKTGGGIMSKSDVKKIVGLGANAIEIGSVAILRPWRVQGIIEYANKLLGGVTDNE